VSGLSGGPRRPRVAVFGLDNLSRKNRSQLETLNSAGYTFDVFTNDSLGDSKDNLPEGNSLTRLAKGFGKRVAQIRRYLKSHSAELNHVEVYPGGRFSAVYVMLARRHGIPVMVVERGDLLYRDRYGPLTRASMSLCYRAADVVWCREFYQERRLKAIGARRVFLLANAVSAPRQIAPASGRDVDFAWVNRLIPERRATWVADVLAEPAFSQVRAVMMGFQPAPPDAGTRAQQADLVERALPNLTLLPYGDPAWLFQSARFFVLPSEIVYCNNALLEAMAHGVVPLVSDVEGARLIVDDGANGFVFPHSPAGLHEAMERALTLQADQYERLSMTAATTARERFSTSAWSSRLRLEYIRLADADVSSPE
jgi:glycosyltransferase involved in cell wall biosynthesis